MSLPSGQAAEVERECTTTDENGKNWVSICGIGSLLSLPSAQRTFDTISKFRVGGLSSFHRVFCMVSVSLLRRGIASEDTRELASVCAVPCDPPEGWNDVSSFPSRCCYCSCHFRRPSFSSCCCADTCKCVGDGGSESIATCPLCPGCAGASKCCELGVSSSDSGNERCKCAANTTTNCGDCAERDQKETGNVEVDEADSSCCNCCCCCTPSSCKCSGKGMHTMMVSVFEVPQEEMRDFYVREDRLQLRAVTVTSLPSESGMPSDVTSTRAVLCCEWNDTAYFHDRCDGDFNVLYDRVVQHYRGGPVYGRKDLLPHPRYLRFCLEAAARLGRHVSENFLDHSFLADRMTTIREFLVRQSYILSLAYEDLLPHNYPSDRYHRLPEPISIDEDDTDGGEDNSKSDDDGDEVLARGKRVLEHFLEASYPRPSE
eukprot:TRINITY_DN12961_c0_g1_i1.p1 TRINITY_DN12961_c0_g1~~TRINITY_DN12961_c0_g1_i1.p1  ORF type:complete len:430 (-),score=52.75 TRINITY_DN12961_c0_g1_i1:323-1612(-)